MFAVLLTVHIIACIAMIVSILLQRSEGGGLGLGTGGGVGSLMTGRGAANAATRFTVLCATVFITTSISLALMAKSTRATNTLIPTSGSGSTLPTSPLPAVPTTPLPILPSESSPAAPASGPAPATQPSAIPIPAAPAAPSPAARTGAAPGSSTPAGAPAGPPPATPTPSGGGH